ncbi:HigA family addiction module antitoxin [Acidithiobacillus sulfurivorans]|uniref:HigA family addiction module antitoxin n=1 Tax=Acidithiobacillus sulfurivorans TaxID=1958756 RepID=UPI001D011AF5|nr:HigA family addiction module antitoxin [Acidithiobacillus sulfurivorans]
MRSNDQWRICFVWRDSNAWDVEIVMGKRAVTPDTGLRLSRFFGMSDGFWVGLQTDYDLAVTRHAMQAILNKIQRYDVHAA